MSERSDLFCGCVWVRTSASSLWYHVAACPDHVMITSPRNEPERVTR